MGRTRAIAVDPRGGGEALVLPEEVPGGMYESKPKHLILTIV